MPAATSSTSIDITSASGPNTTMPSGIATRHDDADEAEHAALPLGLDGLLQQRHRRRREERHGEARAGT